jgi:hypothetical protein
MMTESVLAIIFVTFVLIFVAYAFGRLAIRARLRAKHNDIWVSLGSPAAVDMFLYSQASDFIARGGGDTIADPTLAIFMKFDRILTRYIVRAIAIVCAVGSIGIWIWQTAGRKNSLQPARVGVLPVAMFAAVCLGVAAEARLLALLRRDHQETWATLGSPTLLTAHRGETRRLYRRFIKGGGVRELGDSRIVRLQWIIRILAVTFLASCFLWLLGALRML